MQPRRKHGAGIALLTAWYPDIALASGGERADAHESPIASRHSRPAYLARARYDGHGTMKGVTAHHPQISDKSPRFGIA